MENPERNSVESEKNELELCKKAIETYFQAYCEYLNLKPDLADDVAKSNLTRLEDDARTLLQSLSGDGELRLNNPKGPGYSKLIYINDSETRGKAFHVYSSIVTEEEFDKWKIFLTKKFKERGLNLV